MHTSHEGWVNVEQKPWKVLSAVRIFPASFKNPVSKRKRKLSKMAPLRRQFFVIFYSLYGTSMTKKFSTSSKRACLIRPHWPLQPPFPCPLSCAEPLFVRIRRYLFSLYVQTPTLMAIMAWNCRPHPPPPGIVVNPKVMMWTEGAKKTLGELYAPYV